MRKIFMGLLFSVAVASGSASADPLPNAARWAQLAKSPFPEIGAITEAEQLAAQIQGANVSPKTKQAAKEGLASLERDFDTQIGVVVEVLDRAVTKKHENEEADGALQREGNLIESRRPGPDASEGEVNQFNAQVADYNGRVSALQTKIENDNNTAAKEINEAGAKVDQWVASRVPIFVEAEHKALEMKEGLAWRQLLAAAAGKTDLVFDGNDTSTVDARDVVPMTPEERAKEQQKPRVQPPKTKHTKAPPPPAPSKKK